MSQPVAAFYFVHHTNLSRPKCTWLKEYFELRADGKLVIVSEYEDALIYLSVSQKIGLPWDCQLSTRTEYRAAMTRYRLAERAKLRKQADEKAAKKLLQGKNQEATVKAELANGVLKLVPVTPPPAPLSFGEGADVLADYTVFDCETTGFSAEKDAILQLAAVRITGGVEVNRLETFVRYQGTVPLHITKLTGIGGHHVYNAPEVVAVLQQFRALAGDSLLVGHNVAFDLRFIEANRARFGRHDPLPNRWLCTQVVAASRYPKPYKLGELCARFGIANDGAHWALNDVLMTAKLLQHMHAQQPLTAHHVGQTSAAKLKALATPFLFENAA